MTELVTTYNLDAQALGHITSFVQFGFITGTLTFAFFTISDRFSPSNVFVVCAFLGAIFNLGIIINGLNLTWILALRFVTGFFLAGIYPVGMKIAADYYKEGLGKSLGYLVGALVVGTALPHLIREFTLDLPWKAVLVTTSSLAISGGLLLWTLVKDGPYRKQSQEMDFSALWKVFRKSEFRSAAFGYFGHMWELYAFWAFVPVMLTTFNEVYPASSLNVPLYSFYIIGIGGISCVLGGYISLKFGAKRTAAIALLLSGLCCLTSPIFLQVESKSILLSFLLIWGIVVIADSPLFSTLVAQSADAKIKGTALTIVNSIGFTITIISIQVINILATSLNPSYIFLLLSLGPFFGLIGLYSRKRPTISP